MNAAAETKATVVYVLISCWSSAVWGMTPSTGISDREISTILSVFATQALGYRIIGDGRMADQQSIRDVVADLTWAELYASKLRKEIKENEQKGRENGFRRIKCVVECRHLRGFSACVFARWPSPVL